MVIRFETEFQSWEEEDWERKSVISNRNHKNMWYLTYHDPACDGALVVFFIIAYDSLKVFMVSLLRLVVFFLCHGVMSYGIFGFI